jgi:valyl-tRNA synthetase
MKVLHPFMPFISEEIWHHLNDRGEDECLMVADMPSSEEVDKTLLEEFEYVREVVMGVRKVRKEKNIPLREEISLIIKKNEGEEPRTHFDPAVSKLCKLSSLGYTDKKEEGAVSFIIGSTEFYIPLEGSVDLESEIKKLQEDLKYARGFLKSVEKKLSNERFVNNAPDQVVEKERQKKADAEAKIRVIEEQLSSLKK